jgi:hypothetical protein
MRLLRFVITGLAVVASLLGALALVVIGFVVFVLLRLFGRPAALPRFQRPARSGPARPAYSNRDEVIDVTTTRVND